MKEEATQETFGFWGILELMGRQRYAGFITEETRFGTTMLRIDVPQGLAVENGGPGEYETHYFTDKAIYGVHPCNEAAARAFAIRNKPRPVTIWELQLPEPAPTVSDHSNENYDDYGVEEDDPF